MVILDHFSPALSSINGIRPVFLGSHLNGMNNKGWTLTAPVATAWDFHLGRARP